MDKPSKSEKMMQLPVVSLFSSYKSLKFEIQTKNYSLGFKQVGERFFAGELMDHLQLLSVEDK